jgi:hypothetical protein
MAKYVLKVNDAVNDRFLNGVAIKYGYDNKKIVEQDNEGKIIKEETLDEFAKRMLKRWGIDCIKDGERPEVQRDAVRKMIEQVDKFDIEAE